jgi:hypothetical protein
MADGQLLLIILLASGNGRNDAYFITWFDGCLGVLKKPNVFIVHEDVYEPANVILFIANALFQARVTMLKVVDQVPDGSAFDLNDFLVLGQFAKRGGNTDWYRHKS